MPPRGLDDRPFPLILSRSERIQLLLDNIEFTDWYLQEKLYWQHEVVNYTQYDPLGIKSKRDAQITSMYQDGISLTTIASQFGLSPQRVHQIIRE